MSRRCDQPAIGNLDFTMEFNKPFNKNRGGIHETRFLYGKLAPEELE